MERAQNGVIYFVEATGLGRIKIGFSRNLKKRLHDLQACSPVPLQLIKTVQATIQMEQTLLAVFSKYRRHGEWFDAHADILSLINRLEHGQVFSLEMLVQK